MRRTWTKTRLLTTRTDSGGSGRPPGLIDRLRGHGNDRGGLMLSVPGLSGGLVVLARKSGGAFTQQDRTVARLYVRRLAEDGATVAAPCDSSTPLTMAKFEGLKK